MRICNLIARWMGVLVLLVAVLSMTVPASFLWIDTWTINPMLGIIMFGMGLTLSPHDFKIVLSRPKDILIGCLTQFSVMPLLAWLLVRAFSLPEELALGVILVGCCPGGTASNVITYLAKGDLALSVGIMGHQNANRQRDGNRREGGQIRSDFLGGSWEKMLAEQSAKDRRDDNINDALQHS